MLELLGELLIVMLQNLHQRKDRGTERGGARETEGREEGQRQVKREMWVSLGMIERGSGSRPSCEGRADEHVAPLPG
jgi:hypothetical protein